MQGTFPPLHPTPGVAQTITASACLDGHLERGRHCRCRERLALWFAWDGSHAGRVLMAGKGK